MGYFLQMLLKCNLGVITEDVSEQRTAWQGRYVQGIAAKRTWGGERICSALLRDCEMSVGKCGGFTLPGAYSVGRSQNGQKDLWDQGQNSDFSKVMPKKQDDMEYSAEVQVQAQ